ARAAQTHRAGMARSYRGAFSSLTAFQAHSRVPPRRRGVSRLASLGKCAENMIELVSRARRLGSEIAPVVGVDWPMQRHPSDDSDAAAKEAVKLAGIVGHQANAGAAKHLQHANGDPVVALIIFEPDGAVSVDGVESSVLQLISSNLIGQAETATFLLEVKHDT